jgi:LPS sulfotransferase NodH
MFKECGIAPLRFYYEDMVLNPEFVISRMASFLKIETNCNPSHSPLTSIADEKSTAWSKQFREECNSDLELIEFRRPPLLPSSLFD